MEPKNEKSLVMKFLELISQRVTGPGVIRIEHTHPFPSYAGWKPIAGGWVCVCSIRIFSNFSDFWQKLKLNRALKDLVGV